MLEKIKQIMAEHQADALTKQRKYAVMLPLVRVGDDIHVLYEVRSHRVSQPGETSFPGGSVEKGETYLEAAIRETEEELGIDGEKIEVIGEMDYIVTQTHMIKCYVGWIPETIFKEINPNEEVERVFTIPLGYFLENDPKYYEVMLKMERGNDFPFELISGGNKFKWRNVNQNVPFYTLKDHYLWGYTANLTHRFSQLIKEEEKEND